MSTQTLVEESKDASRKTVVNDFAIQVATVNGSGSQSSNTVLMRSIFQMGIPVSGKNLFPSNIQGLPTWFTIRASKDNYLARKKEVELLVAMNPATAREDVASLSAGAAVIYETSLALENIRDDLVYYPVPFTEIAKELIGDSRLRKLLANMIYVGVVGQIIGIDITEINLAIEKQFKSKPKAIALNEKAVAAGFSYGEEHLTKTDPLRVERMDLTAGKILIDGNSAGALGSMFAGVSVVTWYPITPSSSLVESLIAYAEKYRVDKETGKASFAIVQAEDELAAIGMVIGAAWAGARSMTSTSGPGISLMSEFLGLAYYAEVPAVVWNVQRVGPSTGLPTRTAQGDLLTCYLLSHGDTKHIVLLPHSAAECFEFGGVSFDLAERFQTPVFVLSDLDLGMNTWMSDPFEYPDKPLDRGKVLSEDELAKIGKFARYEDVDGDGIPFRTLPGTDHPLASYFTRGSGHNERADYSERDDDYVKNMVRLERKFDTARDVVPGPVETSDDGARVGIIGFGTSHWAIEEARDQLRKESQLPTKYLRLRALPVNADVLRFIDGCERVYVVEQNRDAQMCQILRLASAHKPNIHKKLRSVLHFSGMPIDARSVSVEVSRLESARKR